MTTLLPPTPGNTGCGPKIERLQNAQALADAVTALVKTAVLRGVQRHGHANLIFSGGGTPEIFLPRVACLSLPWDQVSIVLSDEPFSASRDHHGPISSR